MCVCMSVCLSICVTHKLCSFYVDAMSYFEMSQFFVTILDYLWYEIFTLKSLIMNFNFLNVFHLFLQTSVEKCNVSALDNVFRTPLHWAAVLGETWFPIAGHALHAVCIHVYMFWGLFVFFNTFSIV